MRTESRRREGLDGCWGGLAGRLFWAKRGGRRFVKHRRVESFPVDFSAADAVFLSLCPPGRPGKAAQDDA